MKITDQARAERCAAHMLGNDKASGGAGIKLKAVGPGKATVTLKVEKKHLNGHGICHGGFVFMAADTAFAVACNSYNLLVVSQMGIISHLRQTAEGETLTASAVETYRSGRSGIYDVKVVSDSGKTIAEFRGHSRVIPGRHFEETNNEITKDG